MPDPRFFNRKGPFSVNEIAQKFKCEVIGDKNLVIKDIATLSNAESGDVGFLSNPKYIGQFKTCKASACVIDEKNIPIAPQGMTLLVSNNSYELYAKISDLFYPNEPVIGHISEKASIAKNAKIGQNVRIDDYAIIDEKAIIGDSCHIGGNSYIGKGVVIGANTVIAPQVYLVCCVIGESCLLHAGVKIGQDGFGFSVGKEGINKVKQLGRVIIGNNVEIGANSCIDRGTIEDTVIGDNTKIDNLIQLGHNVEIGSNCFIVAQVGIAGSTKVGNGVMIGGQAGIAGHLEIKDGAKIAAKAGIMQDIGPGEIIGGIPGMNLRDWHKLTAMLKKMLRKGEKNE